MSTSIIVVGASGRMGKTISGLVEADPQFTLAGLVDSPERIAALAGAVSYTHLTLPTTSRV